MPRMLAIYFMLPRAKLSRRGRHAGAAFTLNKHLAAHARNFANKLKNIQHLATFVSKVFEIISPRQLFVQNQIPALQVFGEKENVSQTCEDARIWVFLCFLSR